MEGVMSGVIFNHQARNQQLNNRLAKRNVPSYPLEPNLSFRSQPTKYTLIPQPAQGGQTSTSASGLSYPVYKPSQVFNPGTARAPWSGYACAIDTESVLKNQFFAASKCPQQAFIPGSKSDLYVHQLPKTNMLLKDHPLLYQLPFTDRAIERKVRPVVDSVFNTDSRADRMMT